MTIAEGQRTRLRAIQAADHAFLYELATSDEVAFRWRFQGAIPSRAYFVETLWRDVAEQFIVERVRTRDCIGHAVCYGLDVRNKHARIAMIMQSQFVGTGWGIEAGGLFIEHLFSRFNLRKLYGEMPAYNLHALGSASGTFFKEEGRLREHVYFGDRYWDEVIVAVYREDWEVARSGRFRSRNRLGAEPVGDSPAVDGKLDAL